MHITALIQVVNYLKDLSGDKSFLEKYQKLSETIKKASEGSDEGIIRSINVQKSELSKFLIKSDPIHWGYASYSLFEKINSEKLFGKPAAQYIEDLLQNGTGNFNSIHAKLTKNIKTLVKFSENINKLTNLFEIILPLGELTSSDKEDLSPSLLLYFEGELSVQSISALERYSRLWDNILTIFCNLAETENPPIDICNIDNGNITLRVSVSKDILVAMMNGITEILSVLPDILKIKKIQLEMSTLPLQNDFSGALEEEIEFIKDEKAISAAMKITDSFPENRNSEESIANLARCLKQIMSFVEKGGKIEYHFPETGDDVSIPNKVIIESHHIINELRNIKNNYAQKN
jgi:hypothetical protein